MHDQTSDPVRAIPDPDAVRARLGRALREVRLLRDTLKLAIKVEQERRNRSAEEVSSAGG